ncbi:hypothetical protein OKT76_04550 [Providencia rettgeri]|uniref:hypothetical protein n=1 Tax=Providencia rettgeri TaxID=587 RepID=UPI002270FCC0|nr:hypothetical protein [Providencia rettgeri]MCX9094999.1 hypothetical protein [Providencia rettgeri]
MKQKAKTQTPKRAHRSLRIPIMLDERILQIANQQNKSYSEVLCAALHCVIDDKALREVNPTVIAKYPFLSRYIS